MDDPIIQDNTTPEAVAAVKSSDDLAREAAGIPHPEPGQDIRDYRPEMWEQLDLFGTGPGSDYEDMKEQLKTELLEELRQELNP